MVSPENLRYLISEKLHGIVLDAGSFKDDHVTEMFIHAARGPACSREDKSRHESESKGLRQAVIQVSLIRLRQRPSGDQVEE